jgi:hypothetical protein
MKKIFTKSCFRSRRALYAFFISLWEYLNTKLVYLLKKNLVVKLKNDKKDSFFKSKIKNPGQTAQGFKNSKIFLKNDPLNIHLKGHFLF